MSFSSPEYRAFEDTSISHGTDEHGYFFDERYVSNGTVRITLLRTGGGHGTVGVRYQLLHGTTDGADVTPHAHYTTRYSAFVVLSLGCSHICILYVTRGEEIDPYFFSTTTIAQDLPIYPRRQIDACPGKR